MCCNCCSVLQQKIWVVTIGVLFVGSGISLIIIWPGALELIADSYLPLGPSSWMFNKWYNPPMRFYMYTYLFNWTNMHEATNPNVKPNFIQNGPYVFREVRCKEDVVWHDNDTMTYLSRRKWFFEEQMSGGSLDDVIVLPHPPSVVAAKQVKNMNRYIKKIINYALKTEGGSLGVNRTVKEWLFDGFDDPLTALAVLFLGELIPYKVEKFGFFYGRNASKTYEGSYSIYTGQTNLSLLGELAKWRGSNQSRAFKGECGRINGTNSDIFAPYHIREEPVSLFLPDICRSINLYPTEDMTYLDIKSVKYTANKMSLDNGHLYPNMKCFCSKNSTKCPPTGVIDMGTCLYGIPFYMSLPHFLHADPSYAAAITGMAPDPKEHEFYLILNTRLGVPLRGIANMQFNMLIEADDYIEAFKDVNEFYAPMTIFTEIADIDDDFASLVRLYYKSLPIGLGFGIAMLVIGVILLVLAIYLTYTNKWKGDIKSDTLLKNKSS